MATNDIKPFATAVGANVISQSAYEALTTLIQNGFSSGTAISQQLNKVWRQSSIMSAILAQMIVDNTGANVVDDGTTATILSNLKLAVAGRLINIRTFTASTTYPPTPGTTFIEVEVIGGGGAGGGCPAPATGFASGASPGSGGGWVRKRITSGFAGTAITVGAGGVPAVAAAGGQGGTSSFGTVNAGGGFGGPIGQSYNTFPQFIGTNPPGTSSGGDINGGGQWAQPTILGSPVNNAQFPGSSGSSIYGGSVRNNPDAIGIAGVVPGAGGSGVARSQGTGALAGGAGAPGIVIIREYA